MPTSLGSSPAARQIGRGHRPDVVLDLGVAQQHLGGIWARAPAHSAAKPAAASARPRSKDPNRAAVTRPP